MIGPGPRPSFASVREPLWQQLVVQAGLDAGAWAGERVAASVGEWSLTLDAFRVPVESHEHTRMVVALPHVGLHFRLVEPHAFSWLDTIFGLLDIEIGDDEFDRRWVIKSSSPTRIRELLAESGLRGQIDALEHVSFSLEADRGKPDPTRGGAAWDELVLVRAERWTDPSGLRAMFDLVASTLVRLELLAPEWASR